MTIDALLARGWCFHPYWGTTRLGTGSPTHYAAFYSPRSACDPLTDALCVADTVPDVVAAASKVQTRLTKMLGLLGTDLAVAVIDKGMKLFVTAENRETYGVTVYDFDEYKGGTALPDPVGSGNADEIIAKAVRVAAE